MPTLEPGDQVWIRDQDRYGLLAEKTEKPRSYFVVTEKGTLRRNRSTLVATSTSAQTEQPKATSTPDVTPDESVPRTPPRPQIKEVPPSPQTAVPTTTLGATSEECIPLPNPSPEMLTTRSGRTVRPSRTPKSAIEH